MITYKMDSIVRFTPIIIMIAYQLHKFNSHILWHKVSILQGITRFFIFYFSVRVRNLRKLDITTPIRQIIFGVAFTNLV